MRSADTFGRSDIVGLTSDVEGIVMNFAPRRPNVRFAVAKIEIN